jgi:uncharacterized protein YcfJ
MKNGHIAGLLALLMLSACATAPTGPQVIAMQGSTKSSTQFRYDDHQCRQYASERIDPYAANNAGVSSAVIGTAIGAAAGAAFGGHDGAAVGAGTGLIAGSMIGASNAQYASYDTQHQYDQMYLQCMYDKGHKVPVAGRQQQTAPPAPNHYYPPPPPPPGWRG